MRMSINVLVERMALAAMLLISGFPEDAASGELIGTGLKLRAGGRYDDVRMCVATPAGTKGGVAADISAFAEFRLTGTTVLHADLPVMRPVLFGLAFRMLQFEPSVTLKWVIRKNANVAWVGGPMAGVSLHYGPDYRSVSSGAARGDSFFALGPVFGGYAGVNFMRPDRAYDIQIGVSPYVTPLYSVNDPGHHRGIVIGGLVDMGIVFRGGR